VAMRLRLLVLLVFAVPLAVWFTAEWLHVAAAGGSPVVEGEVVRREETRRLGGIPAGQLTIRIDGTDTLVTADTNRDAVRDLPDRVRFHYTGDPGREVFVEGEENPLWGALILWAITLGITLFCFYPLLRRRLTGQG
jgi:hypothetical protein